MLLGGAEFTGRRRSGATYRDDPKLALIGQLESYTAVRHRSARGPDFRAGSERAMHGDHSVARFQSVMVFEWADVTMTNGA